MTVAYLILFVHTNANNERVCASGMLCTYTKEIPGSNSGRTSRGRVPDIVSRFSLLLYSQLFSLFRFCVVPVVGSVLR
jgi:hypothetical protein